MKRRKVNVLSLAVILALVIYACVSLAGLRQKLELAERTEAELQQQLAELESQNAALQYALENADAPGVLEDVARDQLGLVLPEDKVFRGGGN